MSIVRVRKYESPTNSKFLVVLNELYLKKREGSTGLSDLEKECVSRVENTILLRSLVDPRVPMEYPRGYVPPRMEVELSFAAVTGYMPGKGSEIKDMLPTIVLAFKR